MAEPKKRSLRPAESDTTPDAALVQDGHSSVKPPRLFILCGRDRKIEELREMFAQCGTIRHLQLATDRCNKSRGFAFLQYEDPSCASEAIKQFDMMTLQDGHTLKVSVAREKGATAVVPSASSHKPQPGKLKRNQHSQEGSNRGRDSESSTDGSLPGKRQRSSPPVGFIAPGPLLQAAWKRPTLLEEPTQTSPPSTTTNRPTEDEVADVLNDMITQIVRIASESVEGDKAPTSSSTPAPTKRKAPPTSSSGSIDGASPTKTLPDCTRSTVHPAKHQKSERSVSTQAALHGPAHHQFLMRQRRQTSLDESDSSIDDASDASVGRRKRLSAEPADEDADTETTTQGSTRRRLSDLSELSLSPAGISSPKATVKKRCDRRPPADSSSAFRPVAPIAIPPCARSPARRRQLGPRTTLFFTSTYKFTGQEVDAMFSIYDEFQSVQLVKSFGRVKTMAYVRYATAAAASAVLTTFHEDNEVDDSVVMKLVYADTEPSTPPCPFQPQLSPHHQRPTSTAGESTSSEVNHSNQPLPTHVPDRCWVMVLYDRGLTNEAISSCVAACTGMEFLDIKMIRSTGESQGVAFAKFQSEAFATAASQRLHSNEFPPASRKFLQAIVIADPSQFSVPHNANISAQSDVPELPIASASVQPEDGDLGAVEARFAHLMSGSSEYPSLCQGSAMAEDMSSQEDYSNRPSLPTVSMLGYNQPAYQAPYGHFQFGQPFPYIPSSPSPHPGYPGLYHPHPSHHHPQPWGYEALPPLWPGGGSPMEPDYGHFTWEPPSGFDRHARGNAFDACSVYVSSTRPMELVSLMKAIQDCPGVVGFAKEERDGIAFVVDFAEPSMAADAATKLDGSMCNGHKLRVSLANGSRQPPSRRKRQRVDHRGRRR